LDRLASALVAVVHRVERDDEDSTSMAMYMSQEWLEEFERRSNIQHDA
jgi:hypothetical protein